ncbi:unnamed protein product [Phytophthora fragariaefolia]|uniref:Unnamed protein product n=1 Tax=Phytophthora fragariaefolia TaxID=1490495 RepID=A0A9W6X0L6_9STRA|nr:unnamed protein product [Phytophthora fragariaefolia]
MSASVGGYSTLGCTWGISMLILADIVRMPGRRETAHDMTQTTDGIEKYTSRFDNSVSILFYAFDSFSAGIDTVAVWVSHKNPSALHLVDQTVNFCSVDSRTVVTAQRRDGLVSKHAVPVSVSMHV